MASDTAFNSRVCATYHVDYMDKDSEVGVVVSHGLEPDEATQLIEFANATRASVRSTDSGESFDGMYEPVCLRHLISYASMRNRGVGKTKAFAASILGSLPSRDRSVANELAYNHMTF